MRWDSSSRPRTGAGGRRAAPAADAAQIEPTVEQVPDVVGGRDASGAEHQLFMLIEDGEPIDGDTGEQPAEPTFPSDQVQRQLGRESSSRRTGLPTLPHIRAREHTACRRSEQEAEGKQRNGAHQRDEPIAASCVAIMTLLGVPMPRVNTRYRATKVLGRAGI